MEFRAKRYVLMTLLDKAAKVVPSRDTMPVLKNFYIEAADDAVRVAATDLELSLIVEARLVHVDEPGVAILPSKKLMEIVASAEDEDAVVQIDGTRCEIHIGRASWSLTLDAKPEAYPPMPDLSGVTTFPVDRSEFLAGLQMVYRAAGRATSRPNLMLLDIHDGKITGTDGVRCQQIRMDSWPPRLNMQIPIGAVDELIRLLRTTEADRIAVGETEDHLVFEVGQDVFVASAVAMEFPPVEEQLIVPALVGNEMVMTCDREELSEAVRRVRITADPDTRALVMELDSDTLTLRSKDKMSNSSTEAIDCRWEYEPKQVVVNHLFLADMLEMADARTCSFFIGEDPNKSSKAPLLLRDDTNGMIGIISQMRSDWIVE